MLNASKINGRNDMYIILFGSDIFTPDLHFHNVPDRYQFSKLADARKCAGEFSNAAIFKLHVYPDAYLPDITRIF